MLRHFSLKTEKSYTQWLRRYAAFLTEQSGGLGTTEQKLETFLRRLALSGVSASTQNQAFNALLFFYREVLKQELGPINALRAKRPGEIRQCPTQDDVRRLLAAVTDIYCYPTRLIVHLLYGCGLRVTEPLNLRIKDVDLRESKLYVYQAKGGPRPFPVTFYVSRFTFYASSKLLVPQISPPSHSSHFSRVPAVFPSAPLNKLCFCLDSRCPSALFIISRKNYENYRRSTLPAPVRHVPSPLRTPRSLPLAPASPLVAPATGPLPVPSTLKNRPPKVK